MYRLERPTRGAATVVADRVEFLDAPPTGKHRECAEDQPAPSDTMAVCANRPLNPEYHR